jgi:hypothetical protein
MARYSGYDRFYTTKDGIKVDEAEVKSKKANHGAEWSELVAKATEKTKKRNLDKMVAFARNYGSSRVTVDTEVASGVAVHKYIDSHTKTDPNSAFRMHKRGSMDRLKSNDRKVGATFTIDGEAVNDDF